jgi:hypothetical protein
MFNSQSEFSQFNFLRYIAAFTHIDHFHPAAAQRFGPRASGLRMLPAIIKLMPYPLKLFYIFLYYVSLL